MADLPQQLVELVGDAIDDSFYRVHLVGYPRPTSLAEDVVSTLLAACEPREIWGWRYRGVDRYVGTGDDCREDAQRQAARYAAGGEPAQLLRYLALSTPAEVVAREEGHELKPITNP